MTTETLKRHEASNGIAYHQTGTGPVVVLVHGVGLRAESFGPQIAFLKKSHTVYAIDLPGHGESRGIEVAKPDLGDFTTALEEFVKEVIGEPILLVGHSMGAMIAIDFARRNPNQCRGVSALNAVHRRSLATALAVKQRAAALEHDVGGDLASAPIKRWFGENPGEDEREAAECCSDWLRQVDRCGYAAAYRVFAHHGGFTDVAFASLAMPGLFLTGEGDVNSTPDMSSAMAGLVADGEAKIIPGARHLAQLTHAEQVNAELYRFFERCDSEVPNLQLNNMGGD